MGDTTQSTKENSDTDGFRCLVGGAALMPFHDVTRRLVDEYALDYDGHKLSMSRPDASNVLFVSATLDPAITGAYDETNERSVGIQTHALSRALSEVSVGRGNSNGDAVTLAYNDSQRRFTTSFTQEVDEIEMRHESVFSTLDPDSIRRDKTVENLTEAVDPGVQVRLPRDALVSALEAAAGSGGLGKNTRITSDGSNLRFVSDGADGTEEEVTIPDVAEPSPERSAAEASVSSWFTDTHLADIQRAVDAGLRAEDKVTMRLGDDTLLHLTATRPDVGLHFDLLLAPRVTA